MGRQNGFSLLEIAIVLLIVGLMIGGLVTPLAVQIEQRKVADTNKALDEAKEALTGFAVRYGYLPCPAISASNGLEDRRGGACANDKRDGFLPWATLGLQKTDSWDHLLRYSVTPAFSNATVLFSLQTPRDISVVTRGADGALVQATALKDIPALIMSHGKNGFGATSGSGVSSATPAGTNVDERNNSANATTFISRPASDGGPGGEFDDIVVWLSPNILYHRMVAAQRLPL
ncbi:type II secretion system protein [Janthinobacterium agaricidamnosum]|uniref:Prepilin-type N-terminal cleavage/methylation domain protein n=1 Tax=Janthinobacterium agaricidamnosum NBRC 102515 = DSM 9628 TaxID=1349767 RepID=W0V4C6_9BURK|nr:type II secretion system protein [Janthinobacterium agaricidamnosum]CDG82736.1 prepilin-type N-terminal cleavage/methylation domain protein [Janthinobacterium agaricidamnosum NBRC 102515 = DSM 9628]